MLYIVVHLTEFLLHCFSGYGSVQDSKSVKSRDGFLHWTHFPSNLDNLDSPDIKRHKNPPDSECCSAWVDRHLTL